MQVKEIQSKKLFKEYLIEIPNKDIEDQINSKVKELAPKTNLPGFRPGKAPINLIRKKYEKEVINDVINNIVNENTKKLINDKKLKPIRVPKVEITKFDISKALEFNIKIDLPPIFELCDFKSLKITKYRVKIEKKYIEENYKHFIDSQITFTSIEENRPVKDGELAVISFSSDDSNIPEALKKQQNANIYIGSQHQVLPGLDKILLNKKAKKLDVIEALIELPLKDKDKELKKYKFNIKILDIKKSQKIKIDDNFLKKNNLKSIDELKKKIEDNLIFQYDNLTKEISKKELLDLLEKKHTFELPEGILNDEFNSIWSRVENAKKHNTLDEDDKNLKEEDLKKRYKSIAKRRVKLALIVSTIASDKKISVNEDELRQGLIEYARNYPGQEKKIFDHFKNNPSEIEIIKGPIFEKKVIEHVLSYVKEDEKNITVKELYDIQSKIFKQS